MKKLIAILCGAALIFGFGVSLSGCSGSDEGSQDNMKGADNVNDSGFPIVKNPIKMSLFAPGTGMQEWSKMSTNEEYTKMTGISWDFTTPPLTDVSTKLNLAIASGDYPDVLFGLGTDNLKNASLVKYAEQGILLPLDNLIDKYAPNLKAALEKYPDVKKSITAPDGHIYSLPSLTEPQPSSIWPRGPLWYNGDWLKKLGVTEDTLPKTTDEFYELLKKFKTQNLSGNNDDIPITDTDMNSIRPWLMSAFGILAQDAFVDNGKVVYGPTDPRYKDYLLFMNKLYKENLLDHDVYQQQDEQKKAKGNANRLGVFSDWFPYFTTGKSENASLDYYMFKPLTSSDSPAAVAPMSQGFTMNAFSITKHCQNPPAAMRWVDYFYSEEGYNFVDSGPEGDLYKWETNDKGEKVRVYAKADVTPDNAEDQRGKLSPCYGIVCPALAAYLPGVKTEAQKNDPLYSPFQNFIKDQTELALKPYGKVAFPMTYLTSEESEQITDLSNDLQTAVQSWEGKFITGKEDINAKWDAYVNTINSIGIDQYVKVYQEAYDRYQKD
ncbi:MAG: extracellular solute-binding protein [Bifidobacteriaceae bacterium]|jgi:putative aldouronate transport system substrate-binding protein|nr:extracellular solute-binding protein [Bifidobacteriaceae bacterium]